MLILKFLFGRVRRGGPGFSRNTVACYNPSRKTF